MTFPEYFAGVVKAFTRGNTFGMEITRSQLELTQEVFDFDNVFDPATTKFVILTRKNLKAQAFSFKSARESGVWHLWADGSAATSGRESQRLDDHDIREMIRGLIAEEEFLEEFCAARGIVPVEYGYAARSQ